MFYIIYIYMYTNYRRLIRNYQLQALNKRDYSVSVATRV